MPGQDSQSFLKDIYLCSCNSLENPMTFHWERALGTYSWNFSLSFIRKEDGLEVEDTPSKGKTKQNLKSNSYLQIYCSFTVCQVELNRKIVFIEHVGKKWYAECLWNVSFSILDGPMNSIYTLHTFLELFVFATHSQVLGLLSEPVKNTNINKYLRYRCLD